MDEQTRQFVTTFQAFLDEVVHQVAQESDQGGEPLTPVLEAHLGTDPRSLPVVTEPLSALRFADADIALEVLAGQQGGRRLVGVGGGQERRHSSLSEIVQSSGRFRRFPVGPVDYARVATGPDDSRQVVSFGLQLLNYAGTPVVILQRDAQPQFGHDQPVLEVLAADEAAVPALLDDLRRLMIEHSVLRGQVVSFNATEFGPSNGSVTFLRRPRLTPDDVILPDGVLAKIERHLTGVARHRATLSAAGQHLKRGILLYGPPGTGKTHTVRYLMATSPGTTVILLSGRSLHLVSVAAQTARALEPAVVVLEDVDLIAEDRTFGPGPQPLLFETLDVLDGLAEDADVAFVLTTNRADLLEPALAQRPGRVDLAVEIPLPELESRVRLNELYARELPFSSEALREAASRSDGTTASFAKELMRRALLLAAEAGHPAGDEDLAAALDELLADTESLTRSLLGVGGGEPGDDGTDEGGASHPPRHGWRHGPGPRPGVYYGGYRPVSAISFAGSEPAAPSAVHPDEDPS